jgi:Na+/proline symporter
MTLARGDLVMLLVVIAIASGLVIVFRAQHAGSLAQFLLAGRSVPAWLAGCSLAATSLASGAPLLLTGLLTGPGALGGWLWWFGAMGGLLTASFFARLWRRTGVITDAEFAELRYGGRPAALLRAFRALYFGLPVTLFVTAWLTRIVAAALAPALGLSMFTIAIALTLAAGAWAAVGGLRGLLAAHALECFIGLIASVILAVCVVKAAGGLETVNNALSNGGLHYGTPSTGLNGNISLPALLTGFVVAWWSSLTFDGEPGGGGMTAQRLLATRDERAASLAVLWSLLIQFVIRPWPLIIVAGVLLIQGNPDSPNGYSLLTLSAPSVPSPWRGLVVAGAVMSYLSIVSAVLSRGAGYLVHDIMVRFVSPRFSLSLRPMAVRVAILLLAAVAAPLATRLESPAAIARILLAVGAGSGLTLLLRWFWWRINAWAELASLGVGVVVIEAIDAFRLQGLDGPNGEVVISVLLPLVLGSIAAVGIAFVTTPEATPVLVRFYRRARPGGPGWQSIAKWAGYKEDDLSGNGRGQLVWAIGGAGLLAGMGAGGAWLDGRPELGLVLAGTLVASIIVVFTLLRDERAWQRNVDLSG